VQDEVRTTLRDFILESFLPGEDPATLDASTPLISSGAIPSLALLELVAFIEDAFGVVLDPEHLGIERMDSIDLLAELVAERRGPSRSRSANAE